ncbi:hypothetical protein LA080_009653 [Diaporthe eres]|nr:hypothetical protein LA080_009653 [Diaporthe eres]
MKVSTVVSLAALGFSGITHASSLFNNTCQHFDIHDLDGKPGRAVRLYAECKNFNGDYVQTNLDLNTCFGWADCQFAPYDKDFSHTCNECGNAWHEQDQFGQRFACTGYCDNKDGNGKQQNVAEIDLREYIGNNNGSLYCLPDM